MKQKDMREFFYGIDRIDAGHGGANPVPRIREEKKVRMRWR